MADVVAGLVWRDGLVLLGKRKAGGKRGGLWEMPGGKVEPGEEHGPALQREWMEELQLDVVVRPARIGAASLDLEVSFTVHLYEVEFPETALPVCADHDELKWLSLRYAIEYLPCSPALYLHYPAVKGYIWTEYGREL